VATGDPTFLENLWFVLLCVLWIGYFVLEGFDFGVGMLVRKLGHTQADRRALIHTIGPVWDANEVWLVVAGAGTFAAFPGWYASLFSAFYLALLIVVVALIIRGVSFEFWGKDDRPRWRGLWEWCLIVGSFLLGVLWGVAWANVVRGIPLDANGDFTGNLFDLLGPYALLGGITTCLLFLSHGAIFLTLRTKGDLVDRARAIAAWASPAAAVAAIAFLAWTLSNESGRSGVEVVVAVLAGLVALLLAAAPALLLVRRPGAAFGVSAAAIALLFAALFVDLYPNALVASDPANTLTLHGTASSQYTLTVMTVVAGALLPVVLLYQGWSYWVFRHRVGSEGFGEHHTPLDALRGKG
jgi:cytochrome bd ubiquinol oxidase subunit II